MIPNLRKRPIRHFLHITPILPDTPLASILPLSIQSDPTVHETLDWQHI